jgi:hypothetical protein
MSRIKVLRANPRRALAAMATLLVAVGVTAASGASFTAGSVNPSNTFSSGTLHIDNEHEANAILTMLNMKPNDSKTGTVDIQNDGTLSGVLTLSRSALTDNGIASSLDVVVKDCGNFSSGTPACTAGDPDIYNGTLANMGTVTPITGLGTFSSMEKHRYQFVVTLNSGAGDSVQGKTATATFSWAAA